MEIGAILKRVNLNWFTELLYGERVCRYVVGLTNNTERSIELLEEQIEGFQVFFDNLTIGWRCDPKGKLFIDIGTSTDSLEEARRLQKHYNQQAIRDSLIMEET